MIAAYRVHTLPWTPVREDERRFRRLLGGMATVALLLSLVMPWLPVPQGEKERAPEVPSRYARLVFERSPPAPPPAVAEPQAEPTRETDPDPRPIETEPRSTAEPQTRMPDARDKAAKAGVMAFADSLADLRDHASAASVARQDALSAGTGQTSHNERSLITSRAAKASGGINSASLSRDTGGGAVTGRQTTAVGSSLGGGGSNPSASRGDGSGRLASRSREEIELVFDRNKNAIFALYNRALRHDPGLRGTLVLKLTIAPSGTVTECEVLSSELSDPEFERKLVARVRLFRFEAKDVATVTTTKPIDFFPA